MLPSNIQYFLIVPYRENDFFKDSVVTCAGNTLDSICWKYLGFPCLIKFYSLSAKIKL